MSSLNSRPRRLRLAVLVICALAVGGCQEPTATARQVDPVITVPSEPRFIYECVDPSLGCENPNDTRVSADITFSVQYTATLASSFLDPVTGQNTNVLNVTPPDLHVHVEAGYLTNGNAKITTTYSDGADPTTTRLPQVVRQDLTGNTLTDI